SLELCIPSRFGIIKLAILGCTCYEEVAIRKTLKRITKHIITCKAFLLSCTKTITSIEISLIHQLIKLIQLIIKRNCFLEPLKQQSECVIDFISRIVFQTLTTRIYKLWQCK